MLQPPTRSAKAVAPKKKQNIAIAAVLGLLLGVFIAFFKEFLANSAKEENKAERMKQAKP
jgi:capsular polysaccharide biosynthesis protein